MIKYTYNLYCSKCGLKGECTDEGYIAWLPHLHVMHCPKCKQYGGFIARRKKEAANV